MFSMARFLSAQSVRGTSLASSLVLVGSLLSISGCSSAQAQGVGLAISRGLGSFGDGLIRSQQRPAGSGIVCFRHSDCFSGEVCVADNSSGLNGRCVAGTR